MALNNSGQANFILGVCFFVIAFFFMVISLPAIKEGIDDSRSDLDCDNSSIPLSVYMACLQVDLILPAFVAALIIAGIGAFFLWKSGG